MNGKSFWDTNLWVYLNTHSERNEDTGKKAKLQALLLETEDIFISTQVLNELANVLMKKYGQLEADIKIRLQALLTQAESIGMSSELTFQALTLKSKYKIGWYDSLIVAAALKTQCSILYSEDLQDGLTIEGNLKVINPFLR